MTYYADLNPRFGERYARRWAVFIRGESGEPNRQTILHYVTRKAAERAAARLTEQERDLTASVV